MEINQENAGRVIGSLVGLACGDAVGTTLEFMRPGSFTPITDMVGGGPFSLLPGQWTDDTSMALCLAESLLQKKGFDSFDQMNRYCNWYQYGYFSCTGVCFDIGVTVTAALNKYMKTGDPFSGSTDERSSGNGALMRIAPVAMLYRNDPEKLLEFARDSSRTTHGSAECLDASQYFCSLLASAFNAADKNSIVASYKPVTEKMQSIAKKDFLSKPYQQLTGSGYVIESLESALWCFYQSNSFKEAILLSANLGNDADTTAAICGQLAGAYYGVDAIPESWVKKLAMRDTIFSIAEKLYENAQA